MGGNQYTPEEAAEVGAQVAEMAKGRLPLAPGLRALAEEFPHRPIAGALRRVADRLDAGRTLGEALAAEERAFPAHVRGLIEAGLRTGRLGEALEEYVSFERNRMDLQRRIRLALTYPAVLLFLAGGIIALFALAVVPSFEQFFTDFGADLPRITTAFFWTTRFGAPSFVVMLAFIVLLLVILRTTGRPLVLQRAIYHIPVIGPLWRWSGLAGFCRLMGLLIDQQTPLPEAFRLAAAGARAPDVAAACRVAADRAEAGGSLTESLEASRYFPPTLRAAVRPAETTGPVAEGFRTAAEMFEGRARAYARLLEIVATPVAFALVGGFILFMVLALFLPLIFLVQRLS
jgi:type II secretory pathway component PulF